MGIPILKKFIDAYYLRGNLRSCLDRVKNHRTIYHCCIQKSASQWFFYFWNDVVIRNSLNLRYFNPNEDFCLRTPEILRKLQWLPKYRIVSPLFVRYPDFERMKKPQEYKTFFVARDPRDVIVSSYFSMRYSHPSNPHVEKMRDDLMGMSKEEGIEYFIHHSQLGYFVLLDEWIRAYESNHFAWFRYEDLFGNDQLEHFKRLMDYLEGEISKEALQEVLNRNSFGKISGRDRGEENIHDHYRKGKSKDWIEHFTKKHKRLFKEFTGDLLIRLGYEKDNSW